ncbi:hypothetical protein SAMN05444722_1381 [Rhodovulum sp. ES.010]|uniref:AAA+ family ATPase n=1 Tax=Rhodovulum sp. ES.010 TaxID=1882821 RepID=UPI000926BF48|nr:AAA+ family ATPase [Rhodovulum sp. ES.010]SIO31415.1 hypothetical protein SAMN05444722_1381 [Rhodovulum sp. ES.010]
MIRRAALCLALALAATPLPAQDDGPDTGREGEMREGMELLGEGMRLFFRGLGEELEPALRELAENMEPALKRLMQIVDDFDAYEMPERLPNGDIIIRRKPDAPAPEPLPEGEVEI